MKVPFEKWHGCKNDFLVIWLNPTDDYVFDSLKRQAPALCVRDGSGVGADGIIVLHRERAGDFIPAKLSVINSDGSLAATCGNGIRCAAESVRRHCEEVGRKNDVPEAIELRLKERDVLCTFHEAGVVSVDMGEVLVNDNIPEFDRMQQEISRLLESTSYKHLINDYAAVHIGNRHVVFFCESLHEKMLTDVGSLLQQSSVWDGINVHFVVPKSVSSNHAAPVSGFKIEDAYEALVWERGVGPTKACGSGACAIAAAAFERGDTSRRYWLGIDMPGGRLYVKQSEADDTVTLAGDACFVFSGTLDF